MCLDFAARFLAVRLPLRFFPVRLPPRFFFDLLDAIVSILWVVVFRPSEENKAGDFSRWVGAQNGDGGNAVATRLG